MPRAWELKTERLVLRPFESDDVEDLHRVLKKPAVRRFLLDDSVVSRAWVEATIRGSHKLFEAEGHGLWSVRERGDMSLAGFAGYWHFFDPPQLQLLYGLAPPYWGRGLAAEAARAVVRYGFERLGFEEIRAATDPPNIRSVGVLERLGMRLEQTTVVDGRETACYVLPREGYLTGEVTE